MKKPTKESIEKTEQRVKNKLSLDNIKHLSKSIIPTKEKDNQLIKKNENMYETDSSRYISGCNEKKFGVMGILRIKNILNYKDLRSVILWCRKNDVFIIHQGNRQFVNIWEFTLSFYSPFIKHLKQNNKNWKELFLNYLNGSLSDILGESAVATSITSAYSPNSKKETSFLNKFKKL